MIYSRDPVKNTNKISIFYYFLDTVDKPRYDTEDAFQSMQQCHHGMTIKPVCLQQLLAFYLFLLLG
ncbi:MAG TPA: palindromic element RPE4 domain-containing protein [Rickettsia endosymbiont of Bembidion nr. Transversale]|nr:palindromic element RPE4 domain-containing protein [Rickettsia endosymbiont of Stiretrus anchorago]HJD66414.1 palindromic element RPE4 domain-containing protein [Rickettsia endosymbiont of Bembidion nr. Transversale]